MGIYAMLLHYVISREYRSKFPVVRGQGGVLDREALSTKLAREVQSVSIDFLKLHIPQEIFLTDLSKHSLKTDKFKYEINSMPGVLVNSLKEALKSADVGVVPLRTSRGDMELLLRMRKIIQALRQVLLFLCFQLLKSLSGFIDFLSWLRDKIGEIFMLAQSEAFMQAGPP